eukprot:TRINITY_DN74698_c0_g1_i1.p1 TRINITY_DN74698_c0_g1~~TRINITY_DN74698_c0_g1_i1.p1  ORF type:complete len:431 (+),score=120.48 TRINITY_DN74698_c0_g1_i1:75-1295(+)
MQSLLKCSFCERRSEAVDPAIAEQVREWRKKGNDDFKKQDYASAVQNYSEAIKLQPKESALYVNRSIAFRQLNCWEKAVNDAQTAAELDPSNEKAHYSLGFALRRMGKIEEAMVSCKAGLELQAENKPLIELKANLDEELAAAALIKAQEAPLKETEAKAKGTSKAEASATKAKAAAPKPAAAKKKSYSIDYSKWKDINSDDENEEDAGDEGNEVVELGKNPTFDQRNFLIEEMSKMLRETRKKAQEDLAFESKLELSGAFSKGPKVTTKNLPSDYRSNVGIISLEQLKKFSCSADRMLVSVYGDIYDVSNRVDLFGSGAKSTWSGQDVTWALITGKETTDYFNRFYDIFKLEKDKLERFLRVICHFMVSYTDEHGEPVGRLDKWLGEREMPAPPDEECSDPCKQQ